MKTSRTTALLLVGSLALLQSCSSVVSQRLPRSSVSLLSDALKTADFSLLIFDRPCFSCQAPKVRAQDVVQASSVFNLDPQKSRRLRAILSNPETYVVGFSKPCAEFSPDVALLLRAGKEDNVLLVYLACGTARLVTPSGVAHEDLNIDPAIEDLRRVFQDVWSQE